MSNFEKFVVAAIGILFVAVLFFGIIIFRQQKTINTFAANPAAVSPQAVAKKKNPPGILKIFPAIVENISGNQITVDIKLPDYSKPQNPGGGSTSFIDKKITVNTNNKTVFEKKALADLKVGDAISVSSYDSWTSDTVAAEKVTYVNVSAFKSDSSN